MYALLEGEEGIHVRYALLDQERIGLMCALLEGEEGIPLMYALLDDEAST